MNTIPIHATLVGRWLHRNIAVLRLYVGILRYESVILWGSHNCVAIRHRNGYSLRALLKWQNIDLTHVHSINICGIERLFPA